MTVNRLPDRIHAGRAWGVADQAASSATNFLLSVGVARATSEREFGTFTIAYLIYFAGQTVARSSLGDTLAITRGSHDSPDVETNSSLALGLVAGGIISLASLVLGVLAFRSSLEYMAMAVAIPVLFLADGYRYVFFVDMRSQGAFLIDGVWLLFTTTGLAVSVTRGSSGWQLILWWTVGGVASCLLGWCLTRARPRVHNAVEWFGSVRRTATPLASEQLTKVGATQAALYAVAAIAGLEALGLLRQAQIALGPVSVLVLTGSTVWVRHAVVAARASSTALLRQCVSMAGLVALAAMVTAGLAFWMPSGVGQALLGQDWTEIRPVVLAMAVAMVAEGAVIGALLGLRATNLVNESLRARVQAAPFIVGLTAVGASLAGAFGAALGIFVGRSIEAVRAWGYLLRAGRSAMLRQ